VGASSSSRTLRTTDADEIQGPLSITLTLRMSTRRTCGRHLLPATVRIGGRPLWRLPSERSPTPIRASTRSASGSPDRPRAGCRGKWSEPRHVCIAFSPSKCQSGPAAGALRRQALALVVWPRARVVTVAQMTATYRKGRLIRALFAVLKEHPDGLAAKDAISAVEESIELAPSEKGRSSRPVRRSSRA
jgi:hypothetical protein